MSVYFATSGRYTKIGFSGDPLARVSTITRNGTRPDDVDHCADATLLGWVPGDTAREGQFHWKFADHWVAGEWFVVDEATIRDLIWADPHGVDVQRMSAVAVMAMDRYRDATRGDVAAAGIPVEGVSIKDAFAALNVRLSAAQRGAA